MQDPGFDKNSDATPSSFNTDKQFELMKDKSMRFLPDFANDENRELNIMVQEAERQLREVEVSYLEPLDISFVLPMLLLWQSYSCFAKYPCFGLQQHDLERTKL